MRLHFNFCDHRTGLTLSCNKFEYIWQATILAQKEPRGKKWDRPSNGTHAAPLERKWHDAVMDMSSIQQLSITAFPLPKNIDPGLHKNRRKGRIKMCRGKLQTQYTPTQGHLKGRRLLVAVYYSVNRGGFISLHSQERKIGNCLHSHPNGTTFKHLYTRSKGH